MARIKVFIVNAFTKAKKGGNTAGVIFDADGLSELQMKRIAKQLGFAETAYVSKSQCADFCIRFFSPTDEVLLCGHATIAACSIMKDREVITEGAYLQETKAGILGIEIGRNSVFMEQVPPCFFDELESLDVVNALGIEKQDLLHGLPIQIVSTGLKDVLIPVRSLDVLLGLRPNLEKVSELSKLHGIVSFHVFSLETMFGNTAHCRNFAPLYGISEESATGTSNAALACYLHHHGSVEPELRQFVFEQGYCMDSPSEIIVRLGVQRGVIVNVCVGGEATVVYEHEIEI